MASKRSDRRMSVWRTVLVLAAAPMLERCDRERMPAYLDATTHRNRALYERLGFEITDEFTLGKGAPPLWRMWRPPGAD